MRVKWLRFMDAYYASTKTMVGQVRVTRYQFRHVQVFDRSLGQALEANLLDGEPFDVGEVQVRRASKR